MRQHDSHIGKYRLVAELGHGGMADVHLAWMHGPAGFEKLVVIKQIRPQLADEPEVVGMFLDEARIAARLAHPNVVQTYEVGQDDERYFLAMEYLDGQPLSRVRTRLESEGGLPLAMHLRVLADVLGGLHYAHELTDFDGTPLGMVHRDIAPQNVFLTYEGAVKILDFGIAKATCSSVETRAGTFKGKIAYIAREQLLGERVDRRADVFAVGVMLWEAVTGRRPWTGLDNAAVLERIAAGRFPSARELCPDLPDELEAILDKALAPERGDRYATAADFQADLEAYLEMLGEHVLMRDLGRLVEKHFATEHARIRALVETQMRTGREEEERAAVTPTLRRSSVLEPPTAKTQTGATSVPPSSRNGSTGSLAAVEGPAAGPRVRRRAVLVGLGALAVAAIVGVMIRSPSVSPRDVAPAGLPAAAAPAATALSGEIELDISATPAAATIFLDGAPVGHSPYRMTVRRDGALHEIRVEAPGFVRTVERVFFDRDRTVSVALGVEPAPAEVASTPPAPVHPPVYQGSRRRSVDEKNPYLPR